MNLKSIGANQTEINVNGVIILFSYSTPVAAFVSSIAEIPAGWYKTNKKYSKTTTKHINQWYSGEYQEKDQQWFYNLIAGV